MVNPFPCGFERLTQPGEAVSKPLKLRVFRQTSIRGRTAEVPVESHEVQTDADGRARFQLQLETGAMYVIRCEGFDRFDNAIAAQHSVQISDQKDNVRLRILADQTNFKVGQRAPIRVHWREAPAISLVTYQGARVLGYQLVTLQTGENTLEIPLEGKHAPNFDLHVAVMSDQQQAEGTARPVRFHQAQSALIVDRGLQVAIEASDDAPLDALTPGETIRLKVRTKDAQDNPISTELSLAMVQEALIKRFGEAHRPLDGFFQHHRRLSSVRTASSISFTYRPRTQKVSGLLLAERDRIRRESESSEELEALGDEALFDVPHTDRRSVLEGVNAEAVWSSSAAMAQQLEVAPQGQMAQQRQMSQSRDLGLRLQNAPGQAFGATRFNNQIQSNAVIQGGVVQFDGADVNQAVQQLKQIRPRRTASVAALYANGIVNHINLEGREATWGELAEDLIEQRATLMTGDATYETGYWNPSVITDKDGQAEVEITIPDLSTSWQVTAKGVTKETLIGQGSLKLVAKKDLFGTLKLPLAFTDGDELRIPATIHNQVLTKGELTATLLLTIGSQTMESVQTLPIERKGEQSLLFDLQVRRPDGEPIDLEVDATVSLVVKAGDYEDRYVRVLPVLPKGLPVFATASGSATGDTTAWVDFQDNQSVESPSLRVKMGPSVRASLLEVLSTEGNPFRCSIAPQSDSNASNLMAALALHRLFAQSRDADQPDVISLDQRIRAEISQIVVSQRDDGGWGWAGSQNASDRNVSSRTVWALALAKKAGYFVADPAWDGAINFLRAQLSQTGNADYESKAVLLQGLASAGAGDFALANRLFRNRPSLSTSALLHLALALNEMERPSLALDVLKVVEKRDFTQIQTRRKSNQASLPWSHSNLELKALYAIALQEAAPKSTKIEPVVERLLSDRQGARWSPDKATGPATLAAAQWLEGTKFETDRYQIDLMVNDQHVETVVFDRDTRAQVFEVPREILKPRGKQRIQFRLTGRGQFTYQCELQGYVPSDQIKSTSEDWRVSRYYEPALIERNGKAIPRGFDVLRGGYQSFRNSLTQLPVGQRGEVSLWIRRAGVGSDTPDEHLEYLVVTEPIPAGASVLEDSIRGKFDRYEISPGAITFYLGNRIRSTTLQYRLHGYIPGQYSVLPTVVRDAYRPDLMAVTPSRDLDVIPAGAKSEDEYRLTPRELFELGQLAYGERRMHDVVKHLESLLSDWKLRADFEKRATQMLLDAHLEIGPSHRVVHYFEIVKEKYPELEIPYGQILKIGKAYHEMGEYERCYLIFRATVESSFLTDSQIAGFLQEQHEPLRAVDFMNDLLREYPPETYAASATFDLAQQVYSIAETVAQNQQFRDKNVTRIDLIRQAGAMLTTFLTAYPNDPSADQAAFSYANALLDLERYEAAIEACKRFVRRYPKSRDIDGFWYTIGYCHFAQGQHREALEVCRKVVEMQRRDPKSGRMLPSSNRERAIYILGQIYHSLGEAANAISEYTRVSSKFADAKEAIEYFTRKAISIPEVTQIPPDKPTKVELEFRNIANCMVQVYRIDLMKFGLLKRNLSDITSINLAGIRPLHEEKLELGDGKDYQDRSQEVDLPLAKEGAYLVVCRGDGLHTSGLVLISSLRVDIQEDPQSGRVRATVRDEASDYLAGVHVKVIGSCNEAFVSGDTDLRGVFVADGIHGETTAIAQLDRDRYAFFRGKTYLGVPENNAANEPASQVPSRTPRRKGYSELLEGVRGRNSAIIQDNLKRQNDLFFNDDSGVRVKRVK